MKLAELAELLGCVLVGDGSVEVTGLSGIEEAKEGDLSFVVHSRYFPCLATTKAAAVIVHHNAPSCPRPTLRTDNPYLAFAKALSCLYPRLIPSFGVHPSAILGPGVHLGEGVSIGALCYLGKEVEIGEGTTIYPQVYVGEGSKIGARCLIYPQVTIREGVILGDRVIVHCGAVIGSDGFGYARDADGRYFKIPQVGGVLVEDEVEIGANVTIDRATLGLTRIGRGTKIDNLVQIAHNVVIGQDTVIVAQVGIAGSAKVGDRVTLAGQVGVVDHVEIGDDSTVGPQSGVAQSLPPKSVVTGSPAIPHQTWKRIVLSLPKMPELLKTLRRLEDRMGRLEEKGGGDDRRE